MIARTHDMAAITFLGAAFLIVGPTTLNVATILIAVFANLAGGITPDIDQPTAPFWRNLPIGKYLGRIFGTLIGGHRFITHSLVGLCLGGILVHSLLSFLQPIMTSVNIGYVTWAFMLGMVSHLMMDSLTKEGVPWLLPIPYKFGLPPIRALRITTGKWQEIGLIFPLLVAVNLWLYFGHYDQLVALLRASVMH